MTVVDWCHGEFTVKFSRDGFHFQLADVNFWISNFSYFSSFNDWLKECGATDIHSQLRKA
jgi:hypothetical protein